MSEYIPKTSGFLETAFEKNRTCYTPLCPGCLWRPTLQPERSGMRRSSWPHSGLLSGEVSYSSYCIMIVWLYDNIVLWCCLRHQGKYLPSHCNLRILWKWKRIHAIPEQPTHQQGTPHRQVGQRSLGWPPSRGTRLVGYNIVINQKRMKYARAHLAHCCATFCCCLVG